MTKEPVETSLDEALSTAYDEVTKPEAVDDEVKNVAPEPKVVTAAEPAPEKQDLDKSVEPKEETAKSNPPAHLSATTKAIWNDLAPEVRAEYLRQEQVINKLRSEHAKERGRIEKIDSVLSERRQMLAATYGDEANGLKTLFAISDFAGKDPIGFVQWFSKHQGIDLRRLVPQQGQQQPIDPTVMALRQQVEQLNQQLTGFTQSQQNAAMGQVDTMFKEFSSNPEVKYLEDVKEDMAFLLENGKANDFKDAYDKACKLNPQIVELIETEKQAEREAQKRKEAQEAANKAKKANVMNVATKSVATSTSSPKGNWMDTVVSVGNQLYGS